MRYTSTIQQLQQDAHYKSAAALMEQVLHREEPDMGLLIDLYGVQQAPILQQVFVRFLEQHGETLGAPRPHQYNASTEISVARSQIEESMDFQRLQFRILQREVPEEDELEPFYGEYSSQVRTILRLFMEHRLVRKCGITSAAHLNRVGAVIGKIGMDSPSEHLFATVGVMHDALEDLLDEVRDAHGNIYTVNEYQAFLDRYAAPELHEHVKLITNFYDLLLSEIRDRLSREDHAMTKSNIMWVLEDMYRHERVEIHPYVEKMHYVLEDEPLDGDVYGQAKWKCYSELYIREMAIYTHSRGDYRTFEIKAIDLSDNGHGRDALALSSRIKNLLKQQIYATYGTRLKSTWHGVNNRVAELQEDALVHAEHIIIRDFLQQQSYLDFAMSTLLKILSLRSIFFTDRAR